MASQKKVGFHTTNGVPKKVGIQGSVLRSRSSDLAPVAPWEPQGLKLRYDCVKMVLAFEPGLAAWAW